MDRTAFKALLERYEKGLCSPDEKALVENWFLRQAAAAPDPGEDVDYEHIDQQLRRRIGMDRQPPRPLYRWLAASAAVLLLVTAGYFFWEPGHTNNEPELAMTEILPGGNRATLTLADGRMVELRSDRSGIVVSDDIRYDDGTAIEASSANHSSSITRHSLTTPRGGQYQVRLPDGTKVWLNAETRLDYPSEFTADERIIELYGEAYFDVVEIPDKPFKVRSANQEVRVLGTAFNIHSYDGDARTTLERGSVVVQALGEGRLKELLRPGEQSVLDGNILTRKKVNIAAEMAWKDGLFSYADTELGEVMRDLARWYDLEFSITPRAAALKLDAEISRSLRLSEVLKLLELSVPVEIIAEGRRLIVK